MRVYDDRDADVNPVKAKKVLIVGRHDAVDSRARPGRPLEKLSASGRA
jgi:hypothetical protein